jgi:type I restriction enzyme S subunit
MTEWRECKLSDVMEIIGGGTPKTSVPEYWNGNIPWLSVADFNNGNRYVYDAEKRITELGLKNSSTKILKKGHLIISARGTVGAIAQLGRDMAFNQSCYGLTANSLSTNDFLFYLLKQCIVELKQQSNGGVFDTIIRETFDSINISLPPLPEQKAIAEVLSSLDDKIDFLTRQNNTLEGFAQTYFRRWFLEENDNDTIMVSEIAKLENNSVSPKRQPLEPFHHYSIPAYDNAQTPVVELGNTILSNKFTVQPNSILVSKLNPITPRIWRIDENVMPNSVCSTEFQVLKPYDIKHYLFLYFLMKSDDVVSSFAMSATGTSGSHQRIRPEYILEVETPEPDNDKLILFNEICTPMMERVKKNQQQIITLQKLRDTLLTKLISGEVRVKQ